MSTNIYSVASGGYERLVQADSHLVAMGIALGADDHFAGAKEIMVTRKDDVLRAKGGEGKVVKSVPQKVQAPKGMVLASTLAAELDMTMEGLRYRMRKLRITGQRIAGNGRPLAFTMKEADKLGEK